LASSEHVFAIEIVATPYNCPEVIANCPNRDGGLDCTDLSGSAVARSAMSESERRDARRAVLKAAPPAHARYS
jgi:hypothetical protein